MTHQKRVLFFLAALLILVLRKFNETLSGLVSLCFVGGLLIFPGLGLLLIWKREKSSESQNAFWIPVLSIFYLLFVYLLVDVLPYRIAGWAPPDYFAATVAAIVAVGLFGRVQALGLGSETKRVYHSIREPLLLYLAVVLICYFIVTLGVRPFSEMTFSTISARRTFYSIRTHDNYFQFINGFAISNHRSFEEFYRNGRLIYNYVDREILPGVLYATINYIVHGFSHQWRNAFVIYEQMAIFLGSLIIFPLYALAQRFFPRLRPRTLLALLFCNQFIFVNIYFAWFKMPGAALFLMGLLFILNAPSSISTWAGAGVMWGIAANFHASAALAFPVTLLYLLWSLRQNLSKRFLGGAFSVLCLCFGFLYAPWTAVKKVFYHEPYTMIRQAFMDGYDVHGESSLAKMYLGFWLETPLRTQIHTRWRQLCRIFKGVETHNLLQYLRTFQFQKYVWYRSFLEIDFPIFLFWNQIFFFIAASTYIAWSHRRNRHLDIPSKPTLSAEATAWAKVSLLIFLLLCLVGYSHHEPDCLFHLPLGIVLLGLIFCAGTYLNWHPKVARAYQFLMGLAFIRATLAYILVLKDLVAYT
ncbi:MAG: hypothetical protein JST16_18420 [Bdellovibrionales bacterium]|nr:hypothetical protein [Bdellovibrionales bacterium]